MAPQSHQRFRDRRGTSSLEFAICAPVMLGLFAVMVDVGNLLRARVTMAGAVAAAAQYATMVGTTVTAANAQNVVTNVASTAGLTATSTVTGPGCYCPSTYPVTYSTATCGTTCANNSLPASTYIVIKANYTYTPIAPHLSKIVTTALTETATVLLQ
jgi:Flp pilus assembly protein TadG